MDSRVGLLAAAKRFGTPIYAYEESAIIAQCRELKRHFPSIAFHYAIKANANPALLAIIRREGMGAEAVSLGELVLAGAQGFKASETSFTCSNQSAQELKEAAKAGVRVHLDSLTQLETWGKMRLGPDVSLRLNQGIGAGHHAHVITGGPDSKFGISLADVPAAKKLAKKHGLRIRGLQQHIGSNVLDASIVIRAARTLLSTAASFPDVDHIDFGGGLGIAYQPQDRPLDLKKTGKELEALMKSFIKEQGREIEFAMEPGRFLIAPAGSLLVSVVDMKRTETHAFVGVNSGFNHLIRPAMYGSYHPIENLSHPKRKRQAVTIAGNICESGDVFATDRSLPKPAIGDILAIRQAGAYGFSMASAYNLRALPKEILITAVGRLRDISFSPSEYVR